MQKIDTRTRARRLAVALLAVAAVAAPAASQAAPQQLVGTVGPSFTIALKTSAGKKVTQLKAGTYRIAVSDRSKQHNFHIKGPGLTRELTGVGFVGKRTVTVRLRAGRYTFVCQPHAGLMHGGFVVR